MIGTHVLNLMYIMLFLYICKLSLSGLKLNRLYQNLHDNTTCFMSQGQNSSRVGSPWGLRSPASWRQGRSCWSACSCTPQTSPRSPPPPTTSSSSTRRRKTCDSTCGRSGQLWSELKKNLLGSFVVETMEVNGMDIIYKIRQFLMHFLKGKVFLK